MWSTLRSQLTGKRLLHLLLILIAIAIAALLAFGNDIGYATPLRHAASIRGQQHQRHERRAPRRLRHFADSQSEPIPASTASGGSSS